MEYLLIILVTAAGTKAVEYLYDWLKQRSAAKGGLKILRADDIQEWGWSGDRLLRKLISLDHHLLGDTLNEDREGTVSQWSPVFMARPEGWAVIAASDRKIVGYYSFFALTDSAFKEAREGRLLDREVTIENTLPLDIPGVYKGYFVLLGAHRNSPRAGARLLESVFVELEALGERGILFEEMIANAFTPDGKRICEGFGMTRLCEHEDFGIVYSLKLAPWPQRLSFKRWDGLRAVYQQNIQQSEFVRGDGIAPVTPPTAPETRG